MYVWCQAQQDRSLGVGPSLSVNQWSPSDRQDSCVSRLIHPSRFVFFPQNRCNAADGRGSSQFFHYRAYDALESSHLTIAFRCTACNEHLERCHRRLLLCWRVFMCRCEWRGDKPVFVNRCSLTNLNFDYVYIVQFVGFCCCFYPKRFRNIHSLVHTQKAESTTTQGRGEASCSGTLWHPKRSRGS